MSYNLPRLLNNTSYENKLEYEILNQNTKHISSNNTTTFHNAILDMKNNTIINCPSLNTLSSSTSTIKCKIWSECSTISPLLKLQSNSMTYNNEYYVFVNGIGNNHDWRTDAEIIYQYWMSSPLQRLKPLPFLNNNIIGISHDLISSNRYANYYIRCALKASFKSSSYVGDLYINVWIDSIIKCDDLSEHRDKICLTPFVLKRNSLADDFILTYIRSITYKKHLLNSYPSPIKQIQITIKYQLQQPNTNETASSEIEQMNLGIDAYMIGGDNNNYIYIDYQDVADDSLSDVILGDDNVDIINDEGLDGNFLS